MTETNQLRARRCVEAVREYQVKKDCTLSELALLSGISRDTIINWLNRGCLPHPSQVRKVIHNLGLDADVILGFKTPDLKMFRSADWPVMEKRVDRYCYHIERDNFQEADSILADLALSVFQYFHSFGLPVRLMIFGAGEVPVKTIRFDFRDTYQYAGGEDYQLRFYGNGKEPWILCERIWASLPYDTHVPVPARNVDTVVDGPVSPGLIGMLIETFLAMKKSCEQNHYDAIKEREEFEQQIAGCESELK